MPDSPHIAIIGTGIVGIATAYYLARNHGQNRITLIDRGQPMAFTSAQSGENYRNWWPHPAMVSFTNDSIDLMENIAGDSGNRINMTRRGYALATRADDITPLLQQLRDGLQEDADRLLRFHDGGASTSYQEFTTADWRAQPDGVDILSTPDLIRSHFPSYDTAIRTVLHIRRGGDISGQQLGAYMLEHLREAGVSRRIGIVEQIESSDGFRILLRTSDGNTQVHADRVINAAGPFSGQIAAMLGVDLPIENSFQQKIAFEDRYGVIPRTMPFSIDLDDQNIDWSEDERTALREDPQLSRFADAMPGAIHCRPDGGDAGKWVKLGWAYNQATSEPGLQMPLDDAFPEIVLRGAARLNPAIKTYYGRLPRAMRHYGGWYTMTEENWPLIGPMGVEGAFMATALSGFGTMAACAAGALCAAWVAEADLPPYAKDFSLARYDDPCLMSALRAANKGVL